MVRHNQFIGHPSEDPNEHMGRFLRIDNIVKLNEVRPDVIKLQLFPFSLRDSATSSFESLHYGSVNTSDELVEAFMGRFFPLALTSERRGEEKSLYLSKVKMKVSIMPGKGIRRCLRDVQCMGLIISHRWTFSTMP